MKLEEKYKGSIKLSAIGDALGWITEFEKSKESLIKKFGTDRIESFYSWKKYVGGRFYGFIDNIKSGSYSDDTQLLLAVARSIRKDGSVDNNYFAKIELANWLYYARGGGRTLKVAAKKIKRKNVTWFNNFFNFKVNGESVDYRQCGGNGAAMRVLPIVLANLGDIEKIKEEIFCNSIITHGHPRAILGAMLYGYAVNQIIKYNVEDFNWENYLTQIGSDFQRKFELSFINRLEIRQWLKEWNKSIENTFERVYAETITETQNYLRFVFKSIKQNLSVLETLKMLGCFDKTTKGSGTSTVIAGIYFATKFCSKPIDAIIEAVNALGSDTDSIAAFTGGLVGALYGQNIILEQWEIVQDVKYLDKIAEKLLAIYEKRFEEKNLPQISSRKLLSNLKSDVINLNKEVEFVPLGKGKIIFVDRQSTLKKGKYNLLLEIQFDIGQSILFSKLFDDINYSDNLTKIKINKKEILLQLAEKKLKPKAFEKLVEYLTKHKNLHEDHLDILLTILKNEE